MDGKQELYKGET